MHNRMSMQGPQMMGSEDEREARRRALDGLRGDMRMQRMGGAARPAPSPNPNQMAASQYMQHMAGPARR